jgi:alkylation response protein AidB-like acyl-CoA dehydrogenase
MPIGRQGDAPDEGLSADRLRKAVADLLVLHDPDTTDRTAFLEAVFDAGLAWVHHPPGAGGLGADPGLQPVVDETLRSAGAPRPEPGIAMGMAAPTLAVHGTPEQCRRFLRPLYAGERWCQLFSEPGAGSDLAGLACRAVPDGDTWIVNGQKVWSTLAHEARWGLLIARTDPDVAKHRGLTYFVCDMLAPGVEVRPLRQITGDAEFNEVYLSDVRLPDDLRLGPVGDGWSVAMTTLLHERVAVSRGGRSTPGGGPIGEAVRLYAQRAAGDAARRDRLMSLWVQAEVLRLGRLRASELRRRGISGFHGPITKLAWATLNQHITNFCIDLLGPEGMLYPSGYGRPRDAAGPPSEDFPYRFLRARANSIEGGTSEVLRNTLGEQALGLPREPRADKDVPWRDIPRS